MRRRWLAPLADVSKNSCRCGRLLHRAHGTRPTRLRHPLTPENWTRARRGFLLGAEFGYAIAPRVVRSRSMDTPQLALKCVPPRSHRMALPRGRLERIWQEVNERTVVAICAPRGFGK